MAGGGTAAVSNGVPALSVALVTTSQILSNGTDDELIPAPSYLAADPAGNFYICYNSQILKVDLSGMLTTLAGVAGKGAYTADGGIAATSPITGCASIAGDSAGNVYYQEGTQLRKINPQGVLSTVAGTKGPIFGGTPLVAGPATSVSIGAPRFATVDAAGNIYFYADTYSFSPQIAMVDTSGNLTPTPSSAVTVAASGGDGRNANDATFASITGIALGPSANGAPGNIYVLDGGAYIRQLTPYAPANPPPFLSVGSIVGAGGSIPPIQALSPGGEVTVYGANFFPAGTSHVLQSSDLVNGKIPTNLAGVCVKFGTLPAAILDVYPTQINLQVGALPMGASTVQVSVNCGTLNAISSNIGGVVVRAASPEFYSFLPNAAGNPVAAITLPGGKYVGPPGLIVGATFTPAAIGAVVEAYGTGWGATAPSYGLGVIPGASGALASPFSLALGGVTVPPADILYAGISPCCAGFYQIDFKIPSGTPSGNQSLVITTAGEPSPTGAYIDVQ